MVMELERELHVDVLALRRRHLRAVLRIEQQVYPRPWGMSLFLSELALRPLRHYIAARVGRVLVGYGGIMFAGSDAHVTTIAVDPSWQRRGIGTRLLVGLARAARVGGAEGFTLEVRESNAAAQSLYRAFGFSSAGVRRGYYADSGEDAVVMWAHQITSAHYEELLEQRLLSVPGTTAYEDTP